jgi:hypothetical protein
MVGSLPGCVCSRAELQSSDCLISLGNEAERSGSLMHACPSLVSVSSQTREYTRLQRRLETPKTLGTILGDRANSATF